MFSATALICSLITGDCVNWIAPHVLKSELACELVLQMTREQSPKDPTITSIPKCINWGKPA